MLEKYLHQLCEELSLLSVVKEKEKKTFSLKLGEQKITVVDLDPGVSLKSAIAPCLKKKREDFFIELMRANLLGQATGNTRIGLDTEEKTLTLSLGLPYELSYQNFKDTIEEFVNYLVYWREEIEKFDKQM